MTKAIEALYIHIPFCSHICTYCDFYKMRAKDSVKEEYINTLITELKLRKEYLSSIKTIYIGGGTPSNLKLQDLEKLFKALHEEIDFTKIKEFTIEVNPLDVNEGLSQLFKKYEINRISLGIQSFQESKLKILGRNHRASDCIEALKLLKKAGFNNLNADLIYGLPGDSIKLIRRDLAQLIKLGFTHISSYALIIEEKTILYQDFLKDKFVPLSDEKEAKIYFFIRRFLKTYGYKHYELSNFAKKGYKSLHNLVYWNNERYLALGASASYYIDSTRYINEFNLERYSQGVKNNKITYYEKTKLDITQQMKEEIMLGLRKTDGISLINFYKKYNMRLSEAFPVVKELLKDKLLIIKKDNIMIPSKKLFISNTIILNFM